MTIDLDGPEPLREQVADVLAARIAEGVYEPRRRIPSEAALCEEFGVSRPTVRAAITLLTDKGLVVTMRGKGTYVTARPGTSDE
ncbi:GntR family transcriptional regulator [Nocardiopsis alkaliphila]|uniref:GntR family transcriptional regulator n=1 Tax=Nocardiopsis alkaliphila TaxID=225762 RepID=UPI00034D1686|nr:GntR family transcriptional regulator [Nocardiopsis alkaliphila]